MSLHLLEEMDELLLSPDSFTLHSAMLEFGRMGNQRQAADLYSRVRRAKVAPPWIRSTKCIDVAALHPEVARLATHIFIEEMCRLELCKSLLIITSGEQAEEPDQDGFDSEIKRELHALLYEKWGLRANPFVPGQLPVAGIELDRLRTLRNGGVPPEMKQRRFSKEAMARKFVWTGDDDEEEQ